MTLTRRLAVLLIAGSAVLTAAVRPKTAETVEIAHIRSHFDSVLMELRASSPANLTIQQRTNRTRLMVTLAEYRDRGVFPHNYDFRAPTPYFVDRKTGRLCAVAHLLATTGRRDIVDRVAAANNNVRVMQLASDTALATWLSVNGIALAEAARIQVPYVIEVSPAEQARTQALTVAAPVVLGTLLTTTIWNGLSNADGHLPIVTKTGLVASTITTSFGLWMMAKPEKDFRNAGSITAGIGGTGLAFAARSMRNRSAFLARARVEPIVTADRSTGVGFNVAF